MDLRVPHKDVAIIYAAENDDRAQENLPPVDLIMPDEKVLDQLNDLIMSEATQTGLSPDRLMESLETISERNPDPDNRDRIHVVATYLGELPETVNVRWMRNDDHGLNMRVRIKDES